MAGLPGSIPSQIPAGEDELVRRMRDLERRVDELGPSVARSFQPVLDDLAAKQAALEAQQATLTTAVADIAAQTANLAARVTQTATITSFNTGTLPNDGLFHAYGSSIPITIAVPTGKLVVTVGCGQATLNSGGTGAVEADATFSISGGVLGFMTWESSAYLTGASVGAGIPLMVQREFAVTPGTYTITGQMYAWAASSASCSVNFQQPYLTVQVTG